MQTEQYKVLDKVELQIMDQISKNTTSLQESQILTIIEATE